MIVPYAGTQRACRKYIQEQVIKEGATEFFKDNLQEAISLYTATVWESINQTIVKGQEVMSFLKDISKDILTTYGGNTIEWVTPNGFTVKQKITKSHTAAIKTPLGNTIKERGYIQNLVFQRTEEVNMRKHGTAIAPNLVHSLDACHLQETVNNLSDDVSFAMIHDSFGCHAADAAQMNRVLREVFVDMYKDGEYLNKFLIQQEIQVDEIPEKGSLDLTLVLEDEFFFS
jgi:DNA-directed RNA polymerase